jgi:diguanylate cyclase (GGDEF)-like protein
MPDLLGSVAGLTALHERERLDAAVVGLLAEWLEPAALALYARVGPNTAPRLQCLASARRGQPVRPGEAAWTPLEALPLAAERSELLPALDEGASQFDGPLPPLPAAPGLPLLRNVFPVGLGGRRRGVLELIAEKPLDGEARRFIGGVLQIYRNQLALLDYGERDTLTGLLNRKTFDEAFGKCLLDSGPAAPAGAGDRRAPHDDSASWLGVIDIDHFKRVNDRHGHLIGDEVLLLVAGLLRAAFRHGDRLYRFGGEEFVVLLHADARERAALAFERFREALEAHAFPQVGRVTASAGFTRVRAFDTANAAFDRADRAVYHAKQIGRNRVCCHEVLCDAGVLEPGARSGEIELF